MGKSKPIAEIVSDSIQIQIAKSLNHGPVLYDIIRNGRPLKTNLFAEEVMRWIVNYLEGTR